MSPLLHALLIAICRGFIAAVQLLPLTWVARLGRAGGALAWYIDRRHRRVSLSNLELAFGDSLSPAARTGIAKENFRRLGENYLSALKTPSIPADGMTSRLTIEGFVECLPKDGRPVVIAIGHFGNFELFARARTLAPDWTVATTYRALRQPAVNRVFQALRESSGVRFFERRTQARELKQTLSAGRVALGILGDQHAGDKGLWLPFFGHGCSCSAAPALFALRYSAPLHVGICYRTGLARWKLEFSPEIPAHDRDGRPRSVEDLTREIQSHYEAAIRRDPANWFWVHRRWKPASPQQLRRESSVPTGPEPNVDPE